MIIFLLFYFPFHVVSQTVSIEFFGITHTFDDSTDLIYGVEILIKKGADTLEVLESNANGDYSWKSELSVGDEITLVANRKFFFSRSVIFEVPSYSTKVKLNFDLMEVLIDRQNSPIYQKNSSVQFTGFDVDLMKHQLRRLENFCIEFTHVTYCNESDQIAKRRLKNFKNYLLANNIDISNFNFKNQNLNLKCDTDDCRGRIIGAFISAEEKCN